MDWEVVINLLLPELLLILKSSGIRQSKSYQFSLLQCRSHRVQGVVAFE